MPSEEQKRQTATLFNRIATTQPAAPPGPAPGVLLQHPERQILPAHEQQSTQRPALNAAAGTMFNRVGRANMESPLSRPPVRQSETPKAIEVFNTPEAKTRAVEDALSAGRPFQEAYIKRMEGTKRNKEGKLVTFPDPSKGTLIGYGHLLTPDELKTGHVSIGGQPVKYGLGLTDEQGDMLLTEDTRKHSAAARRVLTDHGVDWDTLPPQAQLVAADLAYQVGEAGFARYKPLMKALRNQDWAEARKHVDRYYRQRETGKLVHDTRRTNHAKDLLKELIAEQRTKR
jgi:GH24 family phage-related lysozyme (muramidase)